MRNPKRFITFSEPVILHGGKSFAVVVETEEGERLDLEIPLNEIGAIVEFMTSVSAFARNIPRQGEQTWSPIPVQGIGFAAGRTPDETLLVVRLAGCDLAFSMESKKVADLGSEFFRIAQTLASDGQPN